VSSFALARLVSFLVSTLAILIGYYYYTMSSTKVLPIVAIAGGTGKLGTHITAALLSPQLASSFKEVRLLTSNPASEAAQQFASKGAKSVSVNWTDEATLLKAIKGADVVINSLGGSVSGFPGKNALMRAAIKDGGVKVYFPSEYGIGMGLSFGIELT
jgi:nucleoside-diphosphate-sugar epimerase